MPPSTKVSSATNVARFAVEGDFTNAGAIRWERLDPAQGKRRSPDEQLLLSVCDQTIGYSYVRAAGQRWAKERHKTLAGWASLNVKLLEDNGLSAMRDDDPFRGHSNIVDWPDDKTQRMNLCQKLKKHALLNIIPEIERGTE